MTHKERVLQLLSDHQPHTHMEGLRSDRIAAMSALIRMRRNAATDKERFFLSKVKIAESGACWIWHGCRNEKGYGRFNLGGAPRAAHRVIHAWFYGPDEAKDLDVDHVCGNPSCVNPIHLEAVTHGENVRRAWERRKAV